MATVVAAARGLTLLATQVAIRLDARNLDAARPYRRFGFTYSNVGSLSMTRSSRPVRG